MEETNTKIMSDEDVNAFETSLDKMRHELFPVPES